MPPQSIELGDPVRVIEVSPLVEPVPMFPPPERVEEPAELPEEVPVGGGRR